MLIFSIYPVYSLAVNPLEEIYQFGEQKLNEAKKSQKKIDSIVSSTRDKRTQYRDLLKQIEGLNAYNQQLKAQITAQEELLQRFDRSIQQVSLIEHQILPLAKKMAGSLEEFVTLDIPFDTAERQERIAFIQENLTVPDLDISEKFRQVLEAYQIENEYGRKIDSYQSVVSLDSVDYEVDVFRIGRIALIAQTKDSKRSAYWNKDTRQWEILDNLTYRTPIRNAIKMAKKQAPIKMLTLPIGAPDQVGNE